MKNRLVLYNTLSRKKEQFEPINPPFVGLYVCGPTVYGDAHLGHARPAITFDLLFRYLKYLGYKVRYVRNITDVGHLTDDSDDCEDKIEKKAKLDRLEPMEIVQFYTNRYHHNMEQLNTLPPSIEPHASGHIIEQEELVKKILDNGFAYESDGSIYFDVEAYNKKCRNWDATKCCCWPDSNAAASTRASSRRSSPRAARAATPPWRADYAPYRGYYTRRAAARRPGNRVCRATERSSGASAP